MKAIQIFCKSLKTVPDRCSGKFIVFIQRRAVQNLSAGGLGMWEEGQGEAGCADTPSHHLYPYRVHLHKVIFFHFEELN